MRNFPRRFLSTSRIRFGGHETAAHGHHEEVERHAVLGSGFFKLFGAVWGGVAVMIAQHHYFTKPDENGVPRIHPITRWILYHRQTEEQKSEQLRQLMLEAQRDAELSVFNAIEIHRPVKDPRYDPRMLQQQKWTKAPTAIDMDHVDTRDLKWRKGYGEDKDAVEVLQAKGLSQDK